MSWNHARPLLNAERKTTAGTELPVWTACPRFVDSRFVDSRFVDSIIDRPRPLRGLVF